MNPIDTLVIDSTGARSLLCFLGGAAGADKSPYNRISHRHPYTAVYSMLFAPLKCRPVRFAEIGVAGGASAVLWDGYFTHPDAQIHMFDRDENFLRMAKERVGDRVSFALTDVLKEDVLKASFDAVKGDGFDVIIDDSTHALEDQIRIVKTLFPFLKPGGMIIVEDVFRSIPVESFADPLADILEQCSAAYFVQCEHEARWSPGWDNDRLLVLTKA